MAFAVCFYCVSRYGFKGNAHCSVLPVGFWRGNGEEWLEGLHASVWLKMISTLGHSCYMEVAMGCVDRKLLTLLRSGVTQRCLRHLAVMLKWPSPRFEVCNAAFRLAAISVSGLQFFLEAQIIDVVFIFIFLFVCFWSSACVFCVLGFRVT